MSHGPSTQWGKDHAAEIKSRLGLIMFAFYTVIYAGFIIINVTHPAWMKIDIGSVNLAIVYGIGLIVIALIQALVYNQICTRAEIKMEKIAEQTSEGGDK